MDKLATLVKILIKLWTAESPEIYRRITNISLSIAIISSILLFSPTILPQFLIPGWVIPLSAFFVALSSKLTAK